MHNGTDSDQILVPEKKKAKSEFTYATQIFAFNYIPKLINKKMMIL